MGGNRVLSYNVAGKRRVAITRPNFVENMARIYDCLRSKVFLTLGKGLFHHSQPSLSPVSIGVLI